MLNVIHVCPSGIQLSFRFGQVDFGPVSAWETDALQLFSAVRMSNLTEVLTHVDTLPNLTVDQLVVASGVGDPDVLVLDARAHGISVLLGAATTVRRARPTILFSVDPPGKLREHDTVEHYMRLVDIAHDLGYVADCIPDRYTYVLRPEEVRDAA